MANYNRQYKWNPPRRRKQRYALVERVVDFSKAPVTSGTDDGRVQGKGSEITTAWAAADVLQAIQVRAGQTVLGIIVEIMAPSTTALATLRIGYGTDIDYWGSYEFAPTSSTGVKADSATGSADAAIRANFGKPLYFSSADTIDIVLNKAITAGKVRLVVHLLEDDR